MRRLRRNRLDLSRRALVQETEIASHHLIAPLFIVEGQNKKESIEHMPGVYRYSTDLACQEAQKLHEHGVAAVLLFPVVSPNHKDLRASEATRNDHFFLQAISQIKESCPTLCIMTDIALDPFTSHGHDGIVDSTGSIMNDETVAILQKMALLHAQSGADYVAPSDMMDGRIEAIRSYLDENGFNYTGIMAYSAKYASAFYGPFRECLGSTLKFGDKKSYQMSPHNIREAITESLQDEAEGADILLIKPASHYLDVVHALRERSDLPIAAYHVSGEYATLHAAAKAGILDLDRALMEHMISIRRAGADIIITYAAGYLLERGLISSSHFTSLKK